MYPLGNLAGMSSEEQHEPQPETNITHPQGGRLSRLLWRDRSFLGRIGVGLALTVVVLSILGSITGAADTRTTDPATDPTSSAETGEPSTTQTAPTSAPSVTSESSTTRSSTSGSSTTAPSVTAAGSQSQTTTPDETAGSTPPASTNTNANATATTLSPTTTATPSTPVTTTAPARGPPTSSTQTGGDLVSDLFSQLRIEPERAVGYDRSLFPHWITTNGCTTRNHVLIRGANGTAQVADNCRVTAGQWYSPFDDVRLTAPGSIDIDHFVPLAEAWRSGADNWDAATRRRFANDLEDPRTLIAVTASSNRSKSDKDPANWLPPHSAYRCTYVGTWVAIKHRWQLAVDSNEHSAIQRVLSGCGPLRTAPTSPTNVATAPAPTTSVPATTTTTTAPPAAAPTTTTVPAGPCININTASSTELERIVHVGPARAQEIISLRPFSSVDDLARVNGIGPARLADIKDQGLACT